MSSDSSDAPSGDLPDRAEIPNAGVFAVCSVTVVGKVSVTLWHGAECDADTTPVWKLRLSPDRPAIIGRAEGHQVYYLDPAYRPTRLLPGTGQNIMRTEGHGSDMYVSRGHFMLRTTGLGIWLVNGVPQPGGGLRPPRNGTRMIAPEQRPMSAGEEYLIDPGATAVIILPNGTEVQICAG